MSKYPLDKEGISRLIGINLDDFIYSIKSKEITYRDDLTPSEQTAKIKQLDTKIKQMDIEEKRKLAKLCHFHGGHSRRFLPDIKLALEKYEDEGATKPYDSGSCGMDFAKLDQMLPSDIHLAAAMLVYDVRPRWLQKYIDERALGYRNFRTNRPKNPDWAFDIDIKKVFDELTEQWGFEVMQAYQFIADELQVHGHEEIVINEARLDHEKRSETNTTKGARKVMDHLKPRKPRKKTAKK